MLAQVAARLAATPLPGFVGEGVEAALEQAMLSGMPVVRVGRGNADGFVPPQPGSLFLAGSNLTATKARLLLMACLLRFGSLPPARDPARPTAAERAAIPRAAR